MSNLVAPTVSVGSPASAATPTTNGMLEGFDSWLKDFQKYEAILAEMAKASADIKFNDELATIEKWFKVLSEAERTASVYTLLQHSTQDQIKFFMAALQKMIKPEENEEANNIDCSAKPKNPKIGLRPPSINIPSPGSPTAQTPSAALKTQGSEAISSIDRLNLPKSGVLQTPLSPFAPQENTLKVPAKSWASMVNTPLVPMFQKPDASRNESSQSSINSSFGGKGPGLAALNTSTLNLLATSGLSNDAQLLAIQLVMSGILRPTEIVETMKQDQAPSPSPAGKKKGTHGNWRAPSTAKHPSGGLRSGMPKTSGLKNNVLKSSGLAGRSIDSAPTESLRTKDFSPELLEDIPAWLRSLRLHKYNSCFESMTWREMVVMDDTMLEKKGVTAMGARRRLIRTFDHVRREMGMEEISNSTPATSALPSGTALTPVESVIRDGPDGSQKAAPTTSLSADSPIFMPTGKAPHCTVPALAVA